MATKRGVSISVGRDVHHALTLAAVNAGPRVGRRVSLNSLIMAAVTLSEQHREELDALLAEELKQVEGGAA